MSYYDLSSADVNRVVVKDGLVWEPTMHLRWFTPTKAVRVRGAFGMTVGEQLVSEKPILQQLWFGKATAGAQTILMKEWRTVPTNIFSPTED